MSASPGRRAASRVLRRVRERGAFGPETLDAVLTAAKLSPQDTALATRLTYGVLQTQGSLDEAIDRFVPRPNDVEPSVRDALRVGAYELLFSRTPARAAVSEAVEAVKAVRREAGGFANAVMRRLAGAADTFPWGDPATDDDALARATGNPRWLVDLWISEIGRERAVPALWTGVEPAPLYLWHNPFAGTLQEALLLLESDGGDPLPCPMEGCVRAGEPARAVRGQAVGSGAFVITDAGAQVAPRAAVVGQVATVADLAAGRGTKTVQLQARARRAGADAAVHSVDVHSFKTAVLQRRMATLGVPRVTAHTGDVTALSDIDGLPGPGTFDAVLLDAPCTGLGTLRRHPERKWRQTPDDVERLAGLQAEMLASAASLVRPGGRVVYSTCTVSRRENQGVVEGFLGSAAGRGFAVAGLEDAVPAEWSGAVENEGWFQSLPSSGGADGHFVAALERKA